MSEVEGNQYAVSQPYGVVVLRVTCRKDWKRFEPVWEPDKTAANQ